MINDVMQVIWTIRDGAPLASIIATAVWHISH